jgi:hypothetical protein
MTDLFTKLLDIFTSADRRRIVITFFLLLVVMIAFPYILEYFNKTARIDQKVDVLTKLSRIDRNALPNEDLKAFYDDIMKEIRSSDSLRLTGLVDQGLAFDSTGIVPLFDLIAGRPDKFLSGAALWIALFFAVPFVRYRYWYSRLLSALLFLGLALAAGLLGVVLPSFEPIAVNYIGLPFVQLLLLLYFVRLYKSLRRPAAPTRPKPNQAPRGPQKRP